MKTVDDRVNRIRDRSARPPKRSCSVVVYDGECPFCQRQMAWIRKRDRDQRFEFVPRQTPGLTERFPDLALADFNSGLRVIPPDGRKLVGADAVYYIARKLRGWRGVALLYRAPLLGFLGRKTYAWIAARRARADRACDADCQT